MPNRTPLFSMQVNEKKNLRPVVLGTVCETQTEVRSRWGSDLPTNACSDPLPLWQVGGMGYFFSSQTHNVEGCTARVFVLRCGTTIKRVDPLCIRKPRPACFVRVWGLEEHACPFEQHGSSKRVAVCKVWRTRGLRVAPRIRLSARESGRAVFQQIVVQDQQWSEDLLFRRNCRFSRIIPVVRDGAEGGGSVNRSACAGLG